MDDNDYNIGRNNYGRGGHSAHQNPRSSRQGPDRPPPPNFRQTSNGPNSQPSALVPYNPGRDNDGFGVDDLESYEKWERISEDSISL